MNPNIDRTTARPDDTAFNIEGNQPSTQHEVNISSEPVSPMDDDSMFSEEDYAACIASQNNMDEDVVHFSPPKRSIIWLCTAPSQTPCVSNEENPGPTPTTDTITSMEPSPPTVIPYSANVPADPTLWDGNFTATSLFGTNEFLNSDINNISCSLQRMACFLRQRNLEGRNGNNIKQLDPFGQSA